MMPWRHTSVPNRHALPCEIHGQQALWRFMPVNRARRMPSGGGRRQTGARILARLGSGGSTASAPPLAMRVSISHLTAPTSAREFREWGICLTQVIALASAWWGGPPGLRRSLLAGRPGGRPRARAPAPHRSTERGLPESSRYPTSAILLRFWSGVAAARFDELQ
jgi:hypothetical protein